MDSFKSPTAVHLRRGQALAVIYALDDLGCADDLGAYSAGTLSVSLDHSGR
jgi:hypothetical protein